ncbi:putative ADP-specific phosphofructokinase [Rhodotorula taiwanensis]|uniref:Putative ADP-specific phosphofructokinase n=1 Tax=Rhodotorula taiwanensis TaxID=741276 RepID=A0A2S5BFD4_9BASI|nr:putative ADP-specific phosphofructokinase [Rhodotorula taiwanensis]
MSARLMQFRAGRAFRQGETNTVVPEAGRGLVYLQEEDGLLHFCYKNLETNQVDEDLIIFPGDASFANATPDRVHVLRFNSSSARHFFWHQDPQLDQAEFEQRGRRVNELIGAEPVDVAAPAAPAAGNMDVEPSSGDVAMSDAPASSTASDSTAFETPAVARTVPDSQTAAAAAAAPPGAPRKLGQAEQLAQLQSILAGLGGTSNTNAASLLQSATHSGGVPEFTLPDVLTPSAATSLIASLPDSSLSHLSSFLPTRVPTLPLSTPAEQRASLIRAVGSPEFRRALASLERALRTGATGPLVQGLGMQARAAHGTQEFLEEVQRQADQEREREGGGAGASEPGSAP